MYSLTKKRYQAIKEQDHSYDGKFIYGVMDDHRVCCPSCEREKNCVPDDVRIFKTNDEALFEGFIPCPDCQPFGPLSEKADLVYRVKVYLAAHYQQRLTLESLSAAFDCSTGVLHRAFMTQTDESPQAYLIRLRMYHAKKMLSQSADSVAVIGLKVGIPNLSYFNTVFKQQTGMTAVQYRKQNR
ncbi:helix-turn-helix domain-containing protein [Fructobacillus sp. M1-13]|uniref:Methylphosphotriester-DNA--protein-cysteine methyltransferase family protein n=1 Tax=Fructobacillus papyriferae TaxID=2713171 RepID=A0ABS5QNN0_9LACO|nr:helix-turn-helix domain-containing protein [Fructobacillus papyriferae]MBS9334728.1 methylphosphotriester-DNA--protein-cysteine methyltransferase family protein [Fructobacillus papyriferae]MCD2158718.1 helix-turn-helix domain-containing protein [Fructobacillus papyriferae]